MKKTILSILVLGALSTVSFAAGNHSGDLRDVQPFMGGVGSTTIESAPLAVVGSGAITNFERTTWLQNSRNESSSNH